MTPLERRSSVSLALIFALRMLGLFLVLPVFALEARKYPGGDDPALVGLAMGIYGLTQAVLQLPLGIASDRFGRKRVIVLGLLVFAGGSLLAALADSLTGLLVGRALQGAGAVSAAVTALLADQTRDSVRTKAMALVGGSIGLMFAVALVAAPVLAAHIGLSGLFGLTCALALAGVAVVAWWVPPEPLQHQNAPRGRLADVWGHPDLLRLNLGVFVLHTVQLSMWVAVPAMLVQAGLTKDHHWQVYLPAVVLSFAAMGGLFALERAGRLRAALLGASPGAGGTGRAGPVGSQRHAGHAVGAGAAAVRFFLRIQCAGGQPAQPGIAHGARPPARRRAGQLQHPAVAGPVCGRCVGWCAGQVGRCSGPVCGDHGALSPVAGADLAAAARRARRALNGRPCRPARAAIAPGVAAQ